jgi:hypothetical protein
MERVRDLLFVDSPLKPQKNSRSLAETGLGMTIL